MTLREELDNVDNYLYPASSLQQQIYKISRIDEDALDYMVPKLIIQPIVENAIYHGLEMKIGQGQIIISAYITETRLIIDIQDDGLGISEEKPAEAERYPFGRKHTDQAAYERLVHRPAERERASA